MRADSHYVDELPAASQPVVRMLPPAQIECRDMPAVNTVESLTRSIADVGMLQPLLIRRHGGRYTLITGRKRLASAIAAGVAAVPCVLHEVDGPAAVALAAADNLRVGEATDGTEEREDVRPVVQAVVADLATVRTASRLMKGVRQGSHTQQVGADLVDAHVRRASWLAGSVVGTFENARLVPLAAILQQVSDGFDAQKRLTGLQLEWSVAPAAAVWKLPEDQTAAVITGAVFAALAQLDGIPQPRVEVHADSPNPRSLRIEVVQRAARVPQSMGSVGATDLDMALPAAMVAAIALRMARALALAHAGSAEMTPLPGQGSVMQITVAAGSAPN